MEEKVVAEEHCVTICAADNEDPTDSLLQKMNNLKIADPQPLCQKRRQFNPHHHTHTFTQAMRSSPLAESRLTKSRRPKGRAPNDSLGVPMKWDGHQRIWTNLSQTEKKDPKTKQLNSLPTSEAGWQPERGPDANASLNVKQMCATPACCKKCTQPALARNYGFCGEHRDPEKKGRTIIQHPKGHH